MDATPVTTNVVPICLARASAEHTIRGVQGRAGVSRSFSSEGRAYGSEVIPWLVTGEQRAAREARCQTKAAEQHHDHDPPEHACNRSSEHQLRSIDGTGVAAYRRL